MIDIGTGLVDEAFYAEVSILSGITTSALILFYSISILGFYKISV